MIIHYNNKTGDIYGTTSGRIHSELEMKCTIRPERVSEKDISSYIVPHKSKQKEVVVKGKKTMVGDGFQYDVPFDEFLYDMEKRKLKIFDFRIFEDKEGNMVFDEAPVKIKPKIDKKVQEDKEKAEKGEKKPCMKDMEVSILELQVSVEEIKKILKSLPLTNSVV